MKFKQNHPVGETEEKDTAIVYDQHTDSICILRRAAVR